MKQTLRRTLLSLCMFLMLFSMTAAAAPAKVKTLKVTANENVITLKWSKVSKAKGYNIYLVDNNTGAEKKYKSTKKTSYTIKKATYYKKYTFKVCAYDKKKAEGDFSPVKSVTVTPKKPNTPKSFRVASLGDRSVTLKWTGVGKCNGGYIIELYNEGTQKYETFKKISSKYTKSITIKKLTDGETYKFRIKGVRTVAGKTLYSDVSKTVSAKVTAFSAAVKSVRTARYEATLKKSTTVKISGKSTTLAKGTKITTSSKQPGNVTAFLKNGSKFSINSSVLKFTGLDCSKKNDYSKTTKQQYINAKGYSSRTNYLIWISQHKVKVNVFKGSKGNWKIVKEFPCVVGKWNARTPNGTYRILKKIRYGEYGGPYMYFTTGSTKGGSAENPIGCAFHNQVNSVISKDDSSGCCRMKLNNLIWLYNNCPLGTTVVVY